MLKINELKKAKGLNGFKSIIIAVSLLSFLFLIGTTGFMLIEGYSFNEAFFMTVITISTVGYSIVKPLSSGGQIFTSALIVVSFGVFAYVVTTFTRYIIDGVFTNYYKDNKVKKVLSKMKGHVIVCGYGRNGRQAIFELLEFDENVVVVEKNEDRIADIQEDGRYLYINGDATDEDVLIQANVSNAKALITTLPDDASNVFVVLTARQLNSGLKIISRASRLNSDVKLKLAGADNVIMPDRIGGQHMAKLVSRPDIVEFIDYIMLQSSNDVSIEEISCKSLSCSFQNATIGEIKVRDISGANIIGIKDAQGTYIFNPDPSIKITQQDQVFVLANPEQIEKLKKIMFT